MKCLNCGAEMITNEVITKKDRISYNMCEKCGSLWLDKGALDKMAFQVQGSIEYCEEDEQGSPLALKCPRCDDQELESVKFLESDSIRLDRCPNCEGFWLNGGQLDAIDDELKEVMPVSGHGFSDFVDGVHVPYWYKRVRKKSSDTDLTIEVEPVKGAKREKSTGDRCPACGGMLDLYRLHHVHFEGCPACKGIWIEPDDLRDLKNRVGESSLRWLNDELEAVEKTSAVATDRPCVRCEDSNLVSVVFGHTKVLIDWCPKCHGRWLDRGEFRAIVDYLRDEMSSAEPAEIERVIGEEARALVHGGPESRFAELLDAHAAVSALLNTKILEHTKLVGLISALHGAFL